MKRQRLEVAPVSSGGWKVTRNGALVGIDPTQTQAIKLARQLAWSLWGVDGLTSTLKIKRPNGQIREERTYPRSSDPKNTKG